MIMRKATLLGIFDCAWTMRSMDKFFIDLVFEINLKIQQLKNLKYFLTYLKTGKLYSFVLHNIH